MLISGSFLFLKIIFYIRFQMLFFFFFFFLLYYFIYLFLAVLGLCCMQAFFQLRRAGAALHCGAWASHCGGFSCGARALVTEALVVVALRLSSCGLQAQQLWCTGFVAPKYVGSSRTRVRTRVPCIGRRILNHCATRKALSIISSSFLLPYFPMSINTRKKCHSN